jgi:SAM-dependent methyltransferase
VLTAGNAAKLYCLQLIDDAAARAEGDFRIVDLGCGDGRNFDALLSRRPNVRYVGVEPSRSAAEAARRRLPSAEIVHATAYAFRAEPADAVVSFSVLEHVVDRPRYFDALRANLADDGLAYVNYDTGHFTRDADATERLKAGVSRVLARLGNESRYRAPVTDDELRSLLSGFRIVDDKGFNTDLKLTYRGVPDEQREAFMQQWLALELALNESGIRFRSGIYRTHNFVLAHL